MATAGDEEIINFTPGDAKKESDICSPCYDDGKRLAAVGYCVNCMEYLCAECFKCHRVPTLSKKHVLLDKDEIKGLATRDNNNCPNHHNRPIKFHCLVHSFLGCYECFFQHQKTCKDVKYIDEVSETFSMSEEFKTYTSKLELAANRSSDILAEIKLNIENTEISHSDAITAFKDFKAHIPDAIDKLEKELIEKAELFKKAQTAKLNKVISKITDVHDAYRTLAAEIDVLQNNQQHNDLYIAVTRNRDKLVSLENELVAIDNDKNVQFLRFDGNIDISKVLKSLWGLITKSSIDRVAFQTDINVESADDTKNCDIFCSVLMPGNKLLVTDYYNKNLKLVSTRQRKLISAMNLSNCPRCIAKVTDNTVAVTIPEDNTIVFCRTEPSLSFDRDLTVHGKCWGIAYKDGKLVVTFSSPDKVKIMDVQGTVFLSIDGGRELFNDPFHVTINPNHDVMYVSNWSGNEIVCLRLDGSVVAVYNDSDLKHPFQTVVDSNGMVYVCADGDKTLTQMTSDCKMIKVLLTSADGLNMPRSISYDETENKFYIGECNMNTIRVYRIRWSTL